MVPVTPPFPLFKLPYLAWRNVLETMHEFDLLKSSLCSQRLKRNIRSLFSKDNELTLQFCGFELYVRVNSRFQTDFELDKVNVTLQGASSLRSAYFSFLVAKRQAERITNGFDVKTWVRHLMETFNCGGVNLTFYCDKNNIEHVKRVVEEIPIYGLTLVNSTPISNSYVVKALEAFQPRNLLSLSQRPDREKPFLHDIITRNYQSITLHFSVTLEEVLTLTSSSITLDILSPDEVNTLIKKHFDGWNPNLRFVRVDSYDKGNYLSVMLNGFNYKELPNNSELLSSWVEYEIKRGDGMMATIKTLPREDRTVQVLINFF